MDAVVLTVLLAIVLVFLVVVIVYAVCYTKRLRKNYQGKQVLLPPVHAVEPASQVMWCVYHSLLLQLVSPQAALIDHTPSAYLMLNTAD